MSERAHRLAAATALATLCGLLLFNKLGMGPFEIYDEGLYGMHAQHALHNDVWLHAVTRDGDFPTGVVKFSKPPLSIWVTAASFSVLGPSLFALRLPFALASFALVIACFLWGLRLRPGKHGAWLGFAWGALFLCSHGSYHFGRTATIEALLLPCVIIALFGYAQALNTRGATRWLCCALSGFAIAGAFFTKQLVCALAIAPIAAVELYRLRRDGLAAVAKRASLVFGIPITLAASWIAALWAEVGKDAARVLWSHAVVKRVQGFDGLHHRNHINRIAQQLDLDAAPMSWELGFAGLLLFVVMRLRSRVRPEDGLLLAGALVCSFLAFDVGSHAILPWYAMTFLPPAAFGNAWLISRALSSVDERPEPDRITTVACALGAAALLLIASNAARDLIPSPLVIAAIGAGIAYFLVREGRPARRAGLAVVVGCSILALAGSLTRDGYHYSEADPQSVLGSGLARLGAKRTSIDERAAIHPYGRTTFFGARARTGKPPWQRTKESAKTGDKRFDSRVEAGILPHEVRPRDGVRLLRAAGMYAVYGDLATPPFASDAIDTALGHGPLTFEAEEMTSERFTTLARDADASSGALRRRDPLPRARPASFLLAHGATPSLPKGSYVARFFAEVRCRGFRGEYLGELFVRRGRKQLAQRRLLCSSLASGVAQRSTAVPLPFRLTSAGAVRIGVRFDQGMVSLDKVEIADLK